MSVYRKDIDGLRAVAVLLVITYHLGFSFIPGGFIGVDIFFVLSGFLITGIINTKIINNSFTFSDFYLKRLRRIYPLLILVILITSLIGYFILLPDDYYQLSKSAGLAFISICNFYFNNISSGYFGSSTEIMPLLHTWSLAVEEQFYLIWPITLISLYKIIRDKNKIPFIMLIVTIVLLFLSQYLALKNSSSSYFLIPARAFELLSGATLALYWKKLPILESTLQNVSSIIALCMLIAVSLLLDKTSTFPGLNAGIVCFATCLFIYTGQSKAIANKWLSFKPVVYVGKISYSLYLWHWPLIAYVNYLSIEKSLEVQIYVFVLTFVLSIASFHLVENTFRFTKKFNLKKTSFLFLGLPIIFLSTFIMVNKETNGIQYRYSTTEQKMLNAVQSGYYTPCQSDICDSKYKDNLIGSLDGADFLLIGDSHASAIRGMINYLANDANKIGAFYYQSGTPLLLEGYIFNKDIKITLNKKVTDNILNFKRTIDNFKGNTVIIANRYSLYLKGRNEKSKDYDVIISKTNSEIESIETSQNNYTDLFINTIDYILSKDKKVILITQIPELGNDLSKCSVLNSYTGSSKQCSISKAKVDERNQKINAIFKMIEHPNLSTINIENIVCDKDLCKTTLNNMPLYQDDDHLSYLGSKYLGKLYLKNHLNPLN